MPRLLLLLLLLRLPPLLPRLSLSLLLLQRRLTMPHRGMPAAVTEEAQEPRLHLVPRHCQRHLRIVTWAEHSELHASGNVGGGWAASAQD